MKVRLLTLVCLALLSPPARSGGRSAKAASTSRARPARRSAIPAGTGDITLFDPAGQHRRRGDRRRRDDHQFARDRATKPATQVVSTATFDVVATRRDAGQPRQVVLPFFNVVMQGGNRVVAKQLGGVALNFAAGSLRAQTSVAGGCRGSTAAPPACPRTSAPS